jgi:hypothetical protein
MKNWLEFINIALATLAVSMLVFIVAVISEIK